jgi:hypothetical protein
MALSNLLDYRGLDAYDYETLTCAASTGLTASKLRPTDSGDLSSGANGKGRCQMILMTATGQTIRFTLNGTTPTATVGHPLAVNEGILLRGYDNLEDLRFIETAATANVQITYFR